MANSEQDKTNLDIARRQESKAFNELEFRTQQAKEQKLQLNSLLEYQNECREGLANALEMGLAPVHMREYQLLMKHINSVVQDIEYKVTASQDNLDIANEVWQEKNEKFTEVKQLIKEKSIAESEAEKAEENMRLNGQPLNNKQLHETAIISKKYRKSKY